MAQGPSNTIFQLPSVFESHLKRILGGNTPQSFINELSDPERETLISELSDVIEKRREKTK